MLILMKKDGENRAAGDRALTSFSFGCLAQLSVLKAVSSAEIGQETICHMIE